MKNKLETFTSCGRIKYKLSIEIMCFVKSTGISLTHSPFIFTAKHNGLPNSQPLLKNERPQIKGIAHIQNYQEEFETIPAQNECVGSLRFHFLY